MQSRCRFPIIFITAGLIALPACTPRKIIPELIPEPVPKLKLEQNSQRLTLAVSPDGIVSFAEHTPLQGRLDVGPILEAEGEESVTLQVMLHLGRYYVIAEGFRNLWEVTPEPGSTRASYRPIILTGEQLFGVRLSHYGPPGRACVRLDVEKGGTWFVSWSGEVHEECQ